MAVHRSVDHYENFPVASVLLPRRQRAAVTALYRFARHADDLADEGDALPAARLAALRALDADCVTLGRAATADDGAPWPGDAGAPHPLVATLRPHVRAHRLPVDLLRDLLSAFVQDVTVHRHADFAALRDYCRRSADPVGRLMLRLFDVDDADLDRLSDRICTGLQLINFVQDAAVDWRRGRLYVPLDELRAAGLTEADLDAALRDGSASPALRALLRAQAARAGAHLASGAPLARRLPGRFAWELRLIVAGGLRLCERLTAPDADPFRLRPTLGARDLPALARLALRPPVAGDDVAALPLLPSA